MNKIQHVFSLSRLLLRSLYFQNMNIRQIDFKMKKFIMLLASLACFTVLADGNPSNPDITKYLPSIEVGSTTETPVNMFFVLDDSASMVDVKINSALGFIPYEATDTYVIPPKADSSAGTIPNYPNGYKQNRVNRNAGNFYGTATETIPTNSFGCTGSTSSAQKNCVIWYSFYSTRALAMESAISIAMNDPIVNNWRVGWGTINPSGYHPITSPATKPIIPNPQGLTPVKLLSTNRVNFLNWLGHLKYSFGTPTQQGVAKAYAEISAARGANDIFAVPAGSSNLMSCTQNYMIFLTDGDATSLTYNNVMSTMGAAKIGAGNGFIQTVPGIANYDAFNHDNGMLSSSLNFDSNLAQVGFYRKKPDPTDKTDISLNDLALKYWYEDMRTDLSNNVAPLYKVKTPEVVTSGGKSVTIEPDWNYKNDPATWQHVVMYSIALGLGASDLTDDYTESRIVGADFWPPLPTLPPLATGAILKGNVEDVAQAAYSSRGKFTSVTTGTELLDAFQNIRNDISSRSLTTTNAGSLSLTQTTSETTDTMYYSISSDVNNHVSVLSATNLFSGKPDDLTKCINSPVIGTIYYEGTLCDKNQPAWKVNNIAPLNGTMKLTDTTARKIVTLKNNSNGAFSYFDLGVDTHNDVPVTISGNSVNIPVFGLNAALTADQITRLSTDGSTSGATDIVNYIYGSPVKEPVFMSRVATGNRNLLGEVTRASGVFVGQLHLPPDHEASDSLKVWSTLGIATQTAIESDNGMQYPYDVAVRMYSDLMSYYNNSPNRCLSDFVAKDSYGYYSLSVSEAKDTCGYLLGYNNSTMNGGNTPTPFDLPIPGRSDSGSGSILPILYQMPPATSIGVDGFLAADGVTRLAEVVNGYIGEKSANIIRGACTSADVKELINILNSTPSDPNEDAMAIKNRCGNKLPDGPGNSSNPNDGTALPVNIRTEMVYTESNDGMLHGFKANSAGSNPNPAGTEIFAYLPDTLFATVKNRVANNYDGAVFNGQLSYYDTYTSKTVSGVKFSIMRTILVGGFGSGATGLFAIDVTNPEKPAPLWEVTKDKADDGVLGYIMQKPSIFQLPDGKWVVIVGSGLKTNPNKDSALFVFDIFTGEELQRIDLPGSIGLDTTTGISTDDKAKYLVKSDGTTPLDAIDLNKQLAAQKYRTNRIYAGDLVGNIWAFNVSTTFDDSGVPQPSVISVDSASNPVTPLFKATDKDGKAQAFSSPFVINKHPSGFGYMVYAGTGELLAKDRLYTNQDSMYGIWDAMHITNKATLTRNDLYPITWSETTDANGNLVRRLTSGNIPWAYRTSESEKPNGSAAAGGWVADTGSKGGVSETIWQPPVSIMTPYGQFGVTFMMSMLNYDQADQSSGLKIGCATPPSADNSYTWNMTFVTSGNRAGTDKFFAPDKATQATVSSVKNTGTSFLVGTTAGTSGSAGVLWDGLTAKLSGRSCDTLLNMTTNSNNQVKATNSCVPRQNSSWSEIK